MALQFKGGKAVPTDDMSSERAAARSLRDKASRFLGDAYGGIDNARDQVSMLRASYTNSGVVNVTALDKAMEDLRDLASKATGVRMTIESIVKRG